MESLTRTDTGAPIGELANYSLRHTATPIDPTNSSGELPSFNATVTDTIGDPKRLRGNYITLRDWTGMESFTKERGSNTKGRVTSVSTNSGVTSIDASTIFERLNTEQTVLPTTAQDALDGFVVQEALTQMCLSAGVPEYSVEGNLRYYVSKWSQIGYMGNSIYKWRYFGPTTTYRSYVTTEGNLGGYDKPIDVNLTQGITFGTRIFSSDQVSEMRIKAYAPHLQQNIIYTIRRDNNSWYVLEKIGSASSTTLHSFVHTLTSGDPAWFFVQFSANAADATKVDIKARIVEWDFPTLASYYSDYSTTGKVSTLRNRPLPYSIELGYDPSIIAGKTYGFPEVGFVTESPLLQSSYPTWQIFMSTSVSSSTGVADILKLPTHVPGFTGNVWEKLREFCSIYDLDILYNLDQIGFMPRESKRRNVSDEFKPALRLAKSNVTEQVEVRDPARTVQVKVYPRQKDSDNNMVMFKADSVYSLEKGETKVEVVQTGNSFQFLTQPVPVSGVPVPYTSAFGSYVITGNDGFIVSPQWWKDNGGSITVKSTKNSGEIEITMQAPTVDTVRAPYRVSEGVADRPALYIMGYGIALQEPRTMTIYTGNPLAAEEVGATLDSTFVMNDIGAINAGHKLACVYGTGIANLSFESSRADYVPPTNTADPITPIADSVYWEGSYYRISDQTITPQGMQFSEVSTHNTVGVLNGEFATGKTVGDWNTLHFGKTISEVNLAPLPLYES